jgi:hypothetical protein
MIARSLWIAAVMSVIASGCFSPTAEETTPPVIRESGEVYVELVSPRSFWTRGEIFVHVTSPDHDTRSGTEGTHYQDLLIGDWSTRVSGDVQKERPGEVGPYPFILFQDVAFNGTWRFEFRLIEASTPWEDTSTIDDQRETYCSYFQFSLPDQVPMKGRYAASRDRYSDGVVYFEWPTKEVIPDMADPPGCQTEPR